MSRVDASLPLITGSPMGSHHRQAKARKAREAALAAEAARPYSAPDLTGLCAARELLGTRVCDKHPHPATVAHEGAGPKDARAEFWGTR